MHHHYSDIRDRIAENPKWWDEDGVPRYSDFGPGESSDIYAHHVALVLIACQSCGHRFRVAMSWGSFNPLHRTNDEQHRHPTPELVQNIHYGDPPNIGCCPSGPTMNCLDLRIIEWWENSNHFWERRGDLEGILPDHPDHPNYQGEG